MTITQLTPHEYRQQFTGLKQLYGQEYHYPVTCVYVACSSLVLIDSESPLKYEIFKAFNLASLSQWTDGKRVSFYSPFQRIETIEHEKAYNYYKNIIEYLLFSFNDYYSIGSNSFHKLLGVLYDYYKDNKLNSFYYDLLMDTKLLVIFKVLKDNNISSFNIFYDLRINNTFYIDNKIIPFDIVNIDND